MKVLFILMRTDMLSMNPGKAIAQGSHATSMFHTVMEPSANDLPYFVDNVPDSRADYEEWRAQANGFGTVLTLGCTESEMREVIKYAQQFDLPCGIVNDPTYPLRDGDTTHFFPVDTCAWVFAEKDDAQDVLSWLQLHP